MIRSRALIVAALLLFARGTVLARGVADSEGWIPLFDGGGLAGWKASEQPESITAEQGRIVCHGPRAHLFYVGRPEVADIGDFELRLSAMTTPGASSGVFFHTAYQDQGVPAKGYEVRINNAPAANEDSGHDG